MKDSNNRKRNESSSLPSTVYEYSNSSSFISLTNYHSGSSRTGLSHSHSRPRTLSSPPNSIHIHIPHKQFSNGSDLSPHSPYVTAAAAMRLNQNVVSNSMSQSHTLHIPMSETAMTPEPFPMNTFSMSTMTTTISKQSNICSVTTGQSPLPQPPLSRKSITMSSMTVMDDSDYKTGNDLERKSPSDAMDNDTVDFKYELLTEEQIFQSRGYKKIKQIAATLQGFVYELQSLKDENVKYVVKKTDKEMHRKGVTVQNGKTYSVKEDILKEKRILEHFTKNDPPTFLVQFIDFFESEKYYYLVMEHGGSDFFKFVIRAHEHIAAKRMPIKVWRKFVKYVIWQLAVMLLWLHNSMKACHLDISLENLLVQNGNFVEQPDGTLSIDTNIQIKMCDFGLAEFFNQQRTNPYLCTKYCGKTTYKSPQVFSKDGPFDARKADVWSMGVVMFCMFVGAPPYKKPEASDASFGYLKKGQIINLLYQWGREKYLTERMLSIVSGLLAVNESDRMTADQIVQHPWLRSYYNKYYDFIKGDLASNKPVTVESLKL